MSGYAFWETWTRDVKDKGRIKILCLLCVCVWVCVSCIYMLCVSICSLYPFFGCLSVVTEFHLKSFFFSQCTQSKKKNKKKQGHFSSFDFSTEPMKLDISHLSFKLIRVIRAQTSQIKPGPICLTDLLWLTWGDAPKDLKVETRWKAGLFSHQWVALLQRVIPSLQAHTQSPWVYNLIKRHHMTTITNSTSPNYIALI